MIAISATTVSVMTVKPAQPKNILVKQFKYVESSQQYILNGYSKGYILKHIYINGHSSDVLVVMEKY